MDGHRAALLVISDRGLGLIGVVFVILLHIARGCGEVNATVFVQILFGSGQGVSDVSLRWRLGAETTLEINVLPSSPTVLRSIIVVVEHLDFTVDRSVAGVDTIPDRGVADLLRALFRLSLRSNFSIQSLVS